MSSPLQLEQRLIEAIRVLTSEKQQSVLDFADFLGSQQNQSPLTASSPESTAPMLVKENTQTNFRTVNLAERGIDPEQAADLRSRLHTFAEDWNRPEMDAYDAL
ncbi:MAG: hypothetical protein AAF921_17665 [Cyanobacteria bacterium P01_D01_bin.44]